MTDTHALALDIVEHAIRNQPRSLQKRIGPSEIGIPCDRRILHKLAGTPEPPRGIPWKPFLGTAMHDMLERVFDATIPAGDLSKAEWITEWEITVGMLDNTPITGHADLFHRPTGTVIDFKLVGNKQLTKYRLHGPSEQYRTQAHLYAKGFTESGGWEPAQNVAIWFLPREAELGKAYWWTEPYNPHIAATALARLNTLNGLLQIVGLEKALTAYPLCDDHWCPFCRREQPKPERLNLFTNPSDTPQELPTPPRAGIPMTPQPRHQNLFQ